MKLSNAVIEFLKANGNVKGANLVIPLTLLEQAAPARVRTSEADRLAKFQRVIADLSQQEDGSVIVPVFLLSEAGLPDASVANPAYWSGIGDGSHMAFLSGYKSRFVQKREQSAYVLSVVLTPLTEQDRETHQKRIAAAAARRAAKKGAATATDSAVVADEGGAVSEDDASEGSEDAAEGSEE